MMTLRRKLGIVSCVVAMALVGFAVMHTGAEPATTQPAPLTISPEARVVLDQVRDAYSGLKTLSVTGNIKAEFDIDGVHRADSANFKGLYAEPGLFRTEMGGTIASDSAAAPPVDAVLGNSGDKIYLFQPDKNRYQMIDAPKGKVDLSALGDDVADLLRRQNLPIALAMSGDAASELTDSASSITRAADVTIDGKPFSAITIAYPQRDITLAVDPASHLIGRTIEDDTKYAKQMGAQQVKSALLTMDYTNSSNVTADATAFAWAPPPGAQLVTGPDSGQDIEGKAAPAFSLTAIDGSQVDSKSLKGTVYLVDFWATWCPTCVAELPHLDALYKELKPRGVRFFAIDVQEDKDTVQKFVKDNKLEIPVLMDPDGKVTDQYDKTGALPFTAIVGKDGTVLKADNIIEESDIRQTIDSALKK
jgi:cytochrome c biogenesis protein CcmG, thiol:disulfide interchange protein DsbE